MVELVHGVNKQMDLNNVIQRHGWNCGEYPGGILVSQMANVFCTRLAYISYLMLTDSSLHHFLIANVATG